MLLTGSCFIGKLLAAVHQAVPENVELIPQTVAFIEQMRAIPHFTKKLPEY